MDLVSRALRGSATSVEIDEFVLLEEMSHRIKNEYAHVVAAISLRAAKSQNDDVKVALADAVELLMRFADVHRALMVPGQSGPVEVCAYLRHLCRLISYARLEAYDIQLVLVESEPLFLPANQCWKLGLSVSELITNAVKHGLRENGGVIRIELVRGKNYVSCCILDNGRRRGRLVAGRGLRLVQSLVESAGGTFDWAFGDRGRKSVIVIPTGNAETDISCAEDMVDCNAPISLSDL